MAVVVEATVQLGGGCTYEVDGDPSQERRRPRGRSFGDDSGDGEDTLSLAWTAAAPPPAMVAAAAAVGEAVVDGELGLVGSSKAELAKGLVGSETEARRRAQAEDNSGLVVIGEANEAGDAVAA